MGFWNCLQQPRRRVSMRPVTMQSLFLPQRHTIKSSLGCGSMWPPVLHTFFLEADGQQEIPRPVDGPYLTARKRVVQRQMDKGMQRPRSSAGTAFSALSLETYDYQKRGLAPASVSPELPSTGAK